MIENFLGYALMTRIQLSQTDITLFLMHDIMKRHAHHRSSKL